MIRKVRISQVVAVAKARRCSGTRGAFPLRFGGQTVFAARWNLSRRQLSLSQQVTIVRCGGPTHTRNRTPQVSRKLARVRSRNHEIFTLCHFMLPDPEFSREVGPCLWAFIWLPRNFSSWTPHGACSRR